MLNTMFGMFDNLSDKNDIYKVETVKDSFVGVSGAPEKVLQFYYMILENMVISSRFLIKKLRINLDYNRTKTTQKKSWTWHWI